MAGIWIAASIATLVSVCGIGFLIAKTSVPNDRRFLSLVALANLPMWFAAFYLIRLPMDSALTSLLGTGATTTAFLFTTTILYAPVTEELAKLWLAILPWFRRRITDETAIPIGLAIGLGFGLGEMWQAAYWLSMNTELASTPWHQFGGFVIERFLVCLNHAVFTTAAIQSIRRAPARAILFAVSLHWLGNFPLFLKEINFGGVGADRWRTIVGIWMPVFSIGMIVLLGNFYAKSRKVSLRVVVNQIIGKAKCPECGIIYQRPLFGVNSGPFLRYERCPGCKKWHKTVRLKSDTESPEGDSTDMKGSSLQ